MAMLPATPTAVVSYGSLNRLTEVSYQGGTRHGQYQSYRYDTSGDRVEIETPLGVTRYGFNPETFRLDANRSERQNRHIPTQTRQDMIKSHQTFAGHETEAHGAKN